MPKTLDKLHNDIEKDLTKERDDKCEPVAEEILQIIARNKPSASVDGSDYETVTKEYAPIHKEVMQLCIDKELTLGEFSYTISIVIAMIGMVKEVTTSSFEMSFKKAEEIVWGKRVDEITIEDIHNLLTDSQ